jgi:molybdate transport system substrate-binding protein
MTLAMNLVLPRRLSGALLLLVAATGHAGDITVSAASSLTNAFQEIGRAFELANPGERVLFNFGASGSLVTQITRGAPVDAFAAADQESMDKAQSAGAVDRATRFNFARNQLVIAVPVDSNLGIAGLRDLLKPGVARVVMGNPESVPAGRYARLALEQAGLWADVKARALNTVNVRQALDYVARGEVEAGFVYLTDVLMMPKRVKRAATVDVPEEILYPVAAVRGGGNFAGGKLFVAFLRTPAAVAILDKYGFARP